MTYSEGAKRKMEDLLPAIMNNELNEWLTWAEEKVEKKNPIGSLVFLSKFVTK
jgi:hypothetical protein